MFRQLYHSNKEKAKLNKPTSHFYQTMEHLKMNVILKQVFRTKLLQFRSTGYTLVWALEEMTKGKSSQQIGRTLGISEQEVNFEIQQSASLKNS